MRRLFRCVLVGGMLCGLASACVSPEQCTEDTDGDALCEEVLGATGARCLAGTCGRPRELPPPAGETGCQGRWREAAVDSGAILSSTDGSTLQTTDQRTRGLWLAEPAQDAGQRYFELEVRGDVVVGVAAVDVFCHAAGCQRYPEAFAGGVILSGTLGVLVDFGTNVLELYVDGRSYSKEAMNLPRGTELRPAFWGEGPFSVSATFDDVREWLPRASEPWACRAGASTSSSSSSSSGAPASSSSSGGELDAAVDAPPDAPLDAPPG